MIPIVITDFEHRKTIKFDGNRIINLEELFAGVAWEDHPAKVHANGSCYSIRRTVAIIDADQAVLYEPTQAEMYGPVNLSDMTPCLSNEHRTEIERHDESRIDVVPTRYRSGRINLNYRRDPHAETNIPE